MTEERLRGDDTRISLFLYLPALNLNEMAHRISAARMSALIIPLLLMAWPAAGQEKIPVLILSGQNNHDWKTTTPALEGILSSSGLYTVSVTNRPDTLKYSDYKQFRLIVSNWNSWPDTSMRWNSAKEEAFTRYMKEGGGGLFIHAGGSSFYGWKDYHKIAIGRWGKNTSHGAIGDAMVHFTDRNHPITQGLADFSLTDEIWENTEIHPGATSLGWVKKFASDGSLETAAHPMLLVNEYGLGRSCYTLLGHDEATLANADLQQLLIRAATWAAGIETSGSGQFGTFQFHPDRKPHFHPLLSPNGTVLTEESPRDHRWHMGLWFSWKFIDSLNYWEYTGDPLRHISEGMTEIQSIKTGTAPSGAKTFELRNVYHPWDKPDEPVMKETQVVVVSVPGTDKSYRIDYDYTFTALQDLTLDRTPIPGEPEGQSWGGYSGMSMRLNNEFRDVRYYTTNNEPVAYGKTAGWVACEFINGTGKREQVIISDDPGNPRYPSPWYCIADSATPMYYFSPAILYKEPMKLRKGEVLHLKYRVWMPKRVMSAEEIELMVKDTRN
jgi:type 1 glutamine amidotransferase